MSSDSFHFVALSGLVYMHLSASEWPNGDCGWVTEADLIAAGEKPTAGATVDDAHSEYAEYGAWHEETQEVIRMETEQQLVAAVTSAIDTAAQQSGEPAAAVTMTRQFGDRLASLASTDTESAQRVLEDAAVLAEVAGPFGFLEADNPGGVREGFAEFLSTLF